jgi:hypothetical protein
MNSTSAKKWAVGALLAAAIPTMASAAVVASGVADIPGTFSFDFDAGAVDNFVTDPAADIFWEQFTSTTRAVVAVNGAQVINLGVVNFAALTLANLQSLSYGTTPISGNDVGNTLVYGDVFAIKTNAGNYAKAIVAFPTFDPSANHGLPIYYETLSSPVPEVDSGLMGLMGLATLGLVLRKRQQRSA